MFVVNYTIVDWGPHGIWLSNCSDDINSTIHDYVTQVAQKITNSSMKRFHEKDSLAGLTAKWHFVTLKSSSINKLGLNNETSENLLQVLKNLKLGLDISQRPVIIIVIIPSVIIIYFIQAWVLLPFVIAIENLQFNRLYAL